MAVQGLWEPWHSPSELPLIHSYLLACNVVDCPLPRTWKCPFMDTEMGARPHPAAGLSGSHHAWVLVKRITFQVTVELGSEGCSLFDGPILPASMLCHDVLDNHRYSRCQRYTIPRSICLWWLKITFLISSFFCFHSTFFSDHDFVFFSCMMVYVLFFLSWAVPSVTHFHDFTTTVFFHELLWFRELWTATSTEP